LKQKHKHIVLFDGVCNLCNSVVQFIIKRDKAAKFTFAALQSDIGKELLEINNLPKDALDTFIYLREDSLLSRSTAALYLLKDLGGFYRLFFAGIIVPRFIRDFFYNLIARSRYNFWGRKESCMIPTEDISSRFLE
jgi:predicted DCC family thiol-disulfide oxidoreductase YuxK